MRHFESSFVTHDRLQLYVQGWQPDGAARAALCLIHGLGEHSSRYAHVGAALSCAGYSLTGFDLRGHGRSEGPRGHSPSFEAWMQDIDGLLRLTAERFPHRPLFLYGHSLGGTLIINYALRRQPAIGGAIVTAPGLKTALEHQKFKLTLVRLLARIMPAVALPTGLDPQSLSRDPAVVAAYVRDPLVHDRLSLGAALGLLQSVRYAFDHAARFNVPLLLMHGGSDRLVFPAGSREFASFVPQTCTLRLWDGLYHEIHNEPEQRQVIDTITSWLGSMTARVSPGDGRDAAH